MTLNEAFYLAVILLELLFFAGMSFYIASLIYSWFSGAPYVATRTQELHELLKKLHLKKGQQFLELGCGDGRVVREAVQRYQVIGTGIDINPLLIWYARWCARLKKVTVTFRRENILHTDLSTADIIYIYLFPALVLQMKELLLQKTKPHVRIVSHGFAIPYLKTFEHEIITGKKFKTYIYRKK